MYCGQLWGKRQATRPKLHLRAYEVFIVCSWSFTSQHQRGHSHLCLFLGPTFSETQKERTFHPRFLSEPHPSEDADVFVLSTVLRGKLMGVGRLGNALSLDTVWLPISLFTKAQIPAS